MRKRQISPIPPSVPPSGQAWLDVDGAASVEVTSEEKGYPIESALLGGENRGWRAANSGTQTIRLIFDEPQTLRRIWLGFQGYRECTHARIPPAMVSRRWQFVSRYRPPTMEF